MLATAPQEFEEQNLENTLRPQSFGEYIGQDKIKKKP